MGITNESIQLIKEKMTLIKNRKLSYVGTAEKKYKIYLNYACYNHVLD